MLTKCLSLFKNSLFNPHSGLWHGKKLKVRGVNICLAYIPIKSWEWGLNLGSLTPSSLLFIRFLLGGQKHPVNWLKKLPCLGDFLLLSDFYSQDDFTFESIVHNPTDSSTCVLKHWHEGEHFVLSECGSELLLDWRKGFQFSKGDSLGFWKEFPQVFYASTVWRINTCSGLLHLLCWRNWIMFLYRWTVDYKLGLNLQLCSSHRICILCFLYVSLLPLLWPALWRPTQLDTELTEGDCGRPTLCHLSSISPPAYFASLINILSTRITWEIFAPVILGFPGLFQSLLEVGSRNLSLMFRVHLQRKRFWSLGSLFLAFNFFEYWFPSL